MILVTDQGLRTTHLVNEITANATGHMQGICGRVFLPASLVEPSGTPCPLCDAVARPLRLPMWRRLLLHIVTSIGEQVAG